MNQAQQQARYRLESDIRKIIERQAAIIANRESEGAECKRRLWVLVAFAGDIASDVAYELRRNWSIKERARGERSVGT